MINSLKNETIVNISLSLSLIFWDSLAVVAIYNAYKASDLQIYIYLTIAITALLIDIKSTGLSHFLSAVVYAIVWPVTLTTIMQVYLIKVWRDLKNRSKPVFSQIIIVNGKKIDATSKEGKDIIKQWEEFKNRNKDFDKLAKEYYDKHTIH